MRKLKVVVGTQLRAKVDFWTPGSAIYVGKPDALMLSYGEIVERGLAAKVSTKVSLHRYAGYKGPIFLDNGSFSFLKGGVDPPVDEYIRFVGAIKPDWFPVPVDYVPAPSSSRRLARKLAHQTAVMNQRFSPLGYVPVVHIGPYFLEYLKQTITVLKPSRIAIGGMVPYIRFSRGATPKKALDLLLQARRLFDGAIHVFGFGGGPLSLHLATAVGVDSVDSSSWRVRASRGLVLVPGRGERSTTLVNGRSPFSNEDVIALRTCRCNVCVSEGMESLSDSGCRGFLFRASHNLWQLLNEQKLLRAHGSIHSFRAWSLYRLKQNRMRYLIEHVFAKSP